jgi:hypothetical protein
MELLSLFLLVNALKSQNQLLEDCLLSCKTFFNSFQTSRCVGFGKKRLVAVWKHDTIRSIPRTNVSPAQKRPIGCTKSDAKAFETSLTNTVTLL